MTNGTGACMILKRHHSLFLSSHRGLDKARGPGNVNRGILRSQKRLSSSRSHQASPLLTGSGPDEVYHATVPKSCDTFILVD